ncbi:unnamed protein product [Rhizoctonia solani]|uniref:Nephrocystin 3-like N-terminal domain-containing protein n=1 Tax=Rhizoctonia solani TaxID=456999 RepID=A0A8H3I428_9AGAM|nr:unnamed protein product [Rhizoctonia solani]
MSCDSSTPDEKFRYYITDIKLQPPIADPNCRISVKVFIDDALVHNLPELDISQPLQWSRLLRCDVSQLSKIILRLCKNIKGEYRSYNFPSYQIRSVDERDGEVTLEHPEVVWIASLKSLTPKVAEQMFLDKLNQPADHTEGVYDKNKPEEIEKYLFKAALRFAGIVAENLSGRSRKLSLIIITRVWEVLEKQSHFDDVIQDILRSFAIIQDILEILDQASSLVLIAALNRSKEPVDNILALLEDASVYLFNWIARSNKGRSPYNETHSNSTYNVGEYASRLEILQKAFHASWSPCTTSCIDPTDTIDHETPALSWKYIQVAEELNTSMADPYEILNLVRPAHPTGYDPEQGCMDGTRKAILNRIITWTQNRDNSESFMWISGQVGMGKSSIAHTLCCYLDNIRALAGSFFCRIDATDFNALGLINSLVYEIAARFPPYAHEVANAIRDNRTLCNAHFVIRYEGLIKRPLRRLKSLEVPITLVVVVDALDECGNHDHRKRALRMLHDMSQLVPWLKVIFTARPETQIVHYIRNHATHQAIIQLQDYDAAGDIRAYIQDQLCDIAKEELPENSINQLCSMAQGVFIWATLATQYIKKSSVLVHSRLQKVLQDHKSPITSHFNTLYTSTLRAVMRDNDVETKEAYNRCIGAIIATTKGQTLTIPDLQRLISVTGQIEPDTVEKIVESLGPLVLITDDQHVTFHHSSFIDYITDSSRSDVFFIQPGHYQTEMANCCLTYMRRHLRFNICNLESSYLLNSDVSDLSLRVDLHIGPVLKYACTHWINHFAASSSQSLVEVVKELMEGPRFMYWIEVLSLLGSIDAGVRGLSGLASLTPIQSHNWGLVASWATDAHSFLLTFFDAIAASMPHLYLSAVAFAPAKSLTAQRMQPYFPNTVSVAQGGDMNWHPCTRTLVHAHVVQSLDISPDGSRIVTGHPNGSVCIWDTRTGAPIHEPLVEHSTSATCVTFSPCGRFIASSSYDSEIRVSNISSGGQSNHVLAGHSSSIHSIAFCPVASLFASGSSDTTIRLWDTKAMQPVGQPYVGHTNRVSCVAFSSDGTKLASGSWDKTIRIWSVDLNQFQLAESPVVITGDFDSVTCIVFSSNGSRLISGSVDKSLRVWDIQASRIESPWAIARHSDGITSIAYSPCAGLIASSALDGEIRLWDAETLIPFSRPFGHLNAVNSIVFSPDGRYMISGSTDMTSRVWEISAFPKTMHEAPFVGHSSTVYAVAISKYGTRFISASADHKMLTWDAQTGASIGDPYAGHTNNVIWAAFDPHETRIVSSSYDKTMRLWDTTTHATINSYQHSSLVYSPVFSPDGSLIVFGTEDGEVIFWEPIEWRKVGEAVKGHSKLVISVAFSPDGTYVASASLDHAILLWDTKTRSHLTTFSGHTGEVRSVAFSPCGNQLVSGSADKKIRIWDRRSGNTVLELAGHTDVVAEVAFSPDGFYIASGSFDKTVRLWSSKTGQCIGQPLTGHASNVRFVGFSPDGNYVISGANDSKIRVWNLDALYAVAEQIDDPPNTFRWPTNPHELSSHPRYPGWVTHDQHSLVFWLPPQYQKPDQLLRTIPRGSPQLSLDYSKLVHGTSWTEVACDAIRRGSE